MMNDPEEETKPEPIGIPRGWVQANYVTATHYLIDVLMEDDSPFRRQWDQFNRFWDDAVGPETISKREELKRIHRGFGDRRVRGAVQRALTRWEGGGARTIDLIRLDAILIAENLPPLISLDPIGFVAKTPGSEQEETYRKHGVPKSITDEIEALRYIYDNGPPIRETEATRRRGNRDPRIKAKRCFSEWIRWMEYSALEKLVRGVAEECGEISVESIEDLLDNLR
jgi:hypothetical protein